MAGCFETQAFRLVHLDEFMTTGSKLANLGGLDSELDPKRLGTRALTLELVLEFGSLRTSGGQVLLSDCLARMSIMKLMLEAGLVSLDSGKGKSVRCGEVGALRCVLGGMSVNVGPKAGVGRALSLELAVERDVVLCLVAKLALK